MYDGTYWVWLSSGYMDGNTYPTAHCTTAAATAAKAATCSNYYATAKTFVPVLFSNTNTYAGAITLNINGQGAKPIYINGSASSASNYSLTRGVYLAYYDGTNYYLRTDGKLTASITGDAATVNGKTVGVNVPSNAKFTDTTYSAASNGGLSLSSNAFSMAAQTGVYVGASNTTPPDYAAIWIQP